MKYLYINNKRILLDDEDFEKVSVYTWREAPKAPGYFLRMFSRGYIKGEQQREYIFLHRYILGVKDPKIKVDHKNNDTLDNRRKNLRLATHQQNMCNRSKQKNNKSGYIGVWWKKDRNKWKAAVRLNRKEHFVGYFDDLLEAVRARDLKVVELHGDYAKVNLERPNIVTT